MRGILWLAGAGALIGAGGLLMTQGDRGADVHKQRDALAFPTRQTSAEASREISRRTLGSEIPALQKDPSQTRARDPLLVALAPDAETALVFEASTILKAPVGQSMLACVGVEDRARMDKNLAVDGKTWLDLADRVAFSKTASGEKLFVVQGNLSGVNLAKLAPTATERPYGAGVTVYDVERNDNHGSFHAAVWHESLLLGSNETAPLEAAIDRLEAGGKDAKLAFDENEAYGEIYGIVGRADFEKIVPEELRDRVHEVMSRAEVHVDATEEVLLVADVQGTDPKQVEDLGKSIGAAMAVGRLEAKHEGQDDLVRLLDLSRVRPFGNGRLRAEVAIPTELMTKHMRACKE